MLAHRRAARLACRPKPRKLSANPALLERVIADLRQWWSPQQIAARLRLEFGDDKSMQLSHETIYQSLFVQGRGELRRELTRFLRTGRAARRPRSRAGQAVDRIADKILISDRPAEAEDRAVPGHWEGDLILGAGNRSAIGTLVESPPDSSCCCTWARAKAPTRSATRCSPRSPPCPHNYAAH